MLRRLKTAVQQQQEKPAPSVSRSSTDANNRGSQDFYEGLVCPECHKTFETIDHLQTHYEQMHGVPTSVENGGRSQSNLEVASTSIADEKSPTSHQPIEDSSSSSSFVCPQCFQELSSADSLQSHFLAMHANEHPDHRDVDVLAMRQEMNDLRATVKEEKRYAAELKKEVDKLHQLVENNATTMFSKSPSPPKAGSENESMYYMQQIQMLEAGKALVTTKMLELDKQLAEMTRTNESVIREKDRVLEKSLNMARDHAALRSQFDEESGRSAARETRLEQLKETVRELESILSQRPSDDDVAVLRKELIHAQTLMNDMAQDKEGETNEWVVKCGQLEKKCLEQEERISNLLVQVKASKEKDATNEKLRSELDEATTRGTEFENRIAQLETTISDQSDELAKSRDTASQLNAQVDGLKSANDNLKEEFRLAREESSSLRLQMEQKIGEVTENQRRHAEYETKIQRLTAEREEFLNSMEMDKSAETALAQLSAENAQLSNSLRDLENQFASFRNESIVENGRHRTEISEKSSQLAESQSKLTTVEDERSSLSSKLSDVIKENSNLKSTIEEKSNAIASLQDRISEMQVKLDESKKFETSAHESIIKMTKLREDFEISEKRWEEERSEFTSAGDDLKRKLDAANAELQSSIGQNGAITQELKSMTEKFELGQKRLSEMETENANLIRVRDETGSAFDQDKREFARKLDEASAAFKAEQANRLSSEEDAKRVRSELDQLKNDKDVLFAEKTAVDEELDAVKGRLEQATKSESEAEKRMAEMSEVLASLKSEKQTVASAKDELADALRETENQAADLRAQLAKIEEMLRSNRDETRAIIMEKQEELEKLADDLEDANEEKAAIQEKLSAELESLKKENETLKERVDQVTKRGEERDRVFEEVLAGKLQAEDSLAKLTAEKDEVIAEKQKEITGLISQRDAHKNEFIEAKTEMERMRSELEKAKSEMADNETKFQKDKDEASKRVEELQNQLVESKNELRRLNDDISSKESGFQQNLNSLTDSLSDLRNQLASRISQLDEETAKSKALETRLKDFERHKTESEDEKRILLERCLLNEKDIEEEKDNCKELQHRLEQAFAAMHELGREHQSFQIDINRHQSRKWTDDTEINNCMKCSKQFTVMIRKHHCRHCGLVFCAECSSKTSHVGASKKPVRVCEPCYNELQSR